MRDAGRAAAATFAEVSTNRPYGAVPGLEVLAHTVEAHADKETAPSKPRLDTAPSVAADHASYLRRKHVASAGLEHPAQAADDPEDPVGVLRNGVARVQPTIIVEIECGSVSDL